MTINVYAGNSQYEKVLDAVREEEPDVVVFQEVTNAWASKFKQLSSVYAYSRSSAREDAFGMAIYSRTEISDVRVRQVGDVPWIEFQVQGEKAVRVLAAHTLPPMGREYWNRRNSQMDDIVRTAERSTAEGIPLVVAGDLNCSPWSPHMRDVIESSALTSARRGFGILPSWPNDQPPLCIPIDHVLVSPPVKVRGFRTGEPTGSDHLPVVVDLRID